MNKMIATTLTLIGCGVAFAHAQTPARLPIITGNGLVNVLIEVDGTVKLWGDPHRMDPSPPFGNGIKASRQPAIKDPSPILPAIYDAADAAVGIQHVLLLKRDGTVLAWGDNDSCQLGNGTGKESLVPVPIPALKNVKQIATGGSATASAALLSDGTVWVWGQVGKGDCIKLPTQVEGLAGVNRFAFDGGSGMAIRDDGSVWTWGENGAGQLCDGSTQSRAVPAQLKGIVNAVDVAIDDNSIIVLGDGTVRMCGSNGDGMLGDPAPGVKQHLTPFQVPGIVNVRSARTVSGTTIVRLSDGTLRGWGYGWYGALGDGRGDQASARPKTPIGLGPVLAHYMSHNTSYAIRADGTVMEWGGLEAPPGSKTEFILAPAVAPFTVKLGQ